MNKADTLRGSSAAGARLRHGFIRPVPTLGILATAMLAVFQGHAHAQSNPAAALDRQNQIIESQQRDRLRAGNRYRCPDLRAARSRSTLNLARDARHTGARCDDTLRREMNL